MLSYSRIDNGYYRVMRESPVITLLFRMFAVNGCTASKHCCPKFWKHILN